MILPALALPSKLAGLSFLVTFLLGTILAMGSYTACIGASCEMLGERVPWVSHLFKSLESALFTSSERAPCVNHIVKSSKSVSFVLYDGTCGPMASLHDGRELWRLFFITSVLGSVDLLAF
jgi:hypothetical protein